MSVRLKELARKFTVNWRAAGVILILLPVTVIGFKVVAWNYDLLDVLPESGYVLTYDMSTDNPRPMTIKITSFAPMNNARQRVIREENISESYKYKITRNGENNVVQWIGEHVSGKNKIIHNVTVITTPLKYVFAPDTEVSVNFPPDMKQYLAAEKMIQTDSPYIRKKMENLTRDKPTVHGKIRAIHNFITREMKYVDYSGPLDAESALKIREASCNGKSRLYVAMVRQLGIPARLVGGIILNKSPKRTIHQWVEIFINGHWVPFCPTNDYFAELPARYINLYYDDNVLLKYTSGISFEYTFRFTRITVPNPGLSMKYRELPLNIFALMENFEKFNISLNILVYLLMLPLGALILVILRNVMGIETFGIFLPILIASVLKSTGLVTGFSFFFGVIFLVYGANVVLTGMGLLYHPKMAILLSMVIACLVVTFILSIVLKNYSLIYVVYFPVAIAAITVNRVLDIIENDGLKKLVIVTANTFVAISICYYFMNSTFLQLSMLSFPEIVFSLIGINILIGRWVGLRLTEYMRFSRFFRSGTNVA